MRHLTDDLIEKLGRVFVYHFIGKNESRLTAEDVAEIKGRGIQFDVTPAITFDQFIQIWERGDDVSEIISATKNRIGFKQDSESLHLHW